MTLLPPLSMGSIGASPSTTRRSLAPAPPVGPELCARRRPAQAASVSGAQPHVRPASLIKCTIALSRGR
eukprot:CAMPEP_0185462656 /NCGR_PEP_ID=MMETSP1365-20130426/93021_1 /TAXON_ID=38817 /ORGANISM="Gephyrocapsa oceanica, Strain RCC1303" /LENGTH=68 /DNA_ID=CAMNT_0028069343 /DNA_START=60 /DNA_END=262 /DNA_ORIENTATION=-